MEEQIMIVIEKIHLVRIREANKTRESGILRVQKEAVTDIKFLFK